MKNKYQAVSLSPFAYLGTSVHTKVHALIAVLLVHVAMLFITASWNSLFVLLGAVLASFSVVGIGYFFERKRVFDWMSALLRGLVIGLLLPATYPPVSVFLVTLCVLLVCDYFLGGFTHAWVNAAALTVAVCWLLSTPLFPAFSLQAEQLQTKNAALLLIQNGTFPVMPLDARITAFLNKTVFALFGVSIPEGYVSLFWDTHALIPAFRFNILTLVSSIFLFAFDIVSALMPAVYVVVYCLLVRFFAPVFYGGAIGQGDMLLALLTSGTLFCTIFLLQWYGTIPISVPGKCCAAFLGGGIAFFIVGAGESGVGGVFTVLVMNVITPVIHVIEAASEQHYLHAELLPKVKAFKDGHDA